MLVLSRQRDESIMIGDDVEITIVDVRGDKVRLGITAPKSIPVHRREIYDAIQREKAEAKKADEQPEKPARRQPEKSAQQHAEKDPQEQPEEEPQQQR
jgi:carbon storage regulator